MKKIDLEAHFFTKGYLEFLRAKGIQPSRLHLDSLLDLGEGRLKYMDAAGIDVQVLDLDSGHIQQIEPSEATTWAKNTNDELAAAVRKYPDRFIGLAALAPQNPDEAADELERAVTELGLKGWSAKSHTRNEYLDDRKFWVIFERAEKLGVPVHLHPSLPSKGMLKPYADYGAAMSMSLGFAAEAALHSMRLIYSGLFDRYPGLKIILGHMGEGLPYWLHRLDYSWRHPGMQQIPKIERRPSEYIKTNFIITTSGMFYQPALTCAYMALGADNTAFAVDYPYEDSEEGVRFIEEAQIPDSDREKICHLNAEKLFR